MRPESLTLEPLRDRAEAGRRLADVLWPFRAEYPVVLGIPRGGVVVAVEIARRLDSPLDILVVRKIGAPGDPEYGLGAIAEGAVESLDEARIRAGGYSPVELAETLRRERSELDRRVRVYRGNRPRIDLHDRTVIIADDGVATGGTVLAAIQSVRIFRPTRLILALGVCPASTFRELRPLVDELAVLCLPDYFHAVGEWYREFPEVPDARVLSLLNGIWNRGQPVAAGG